MGDIVYMMKLLGVTFRVPSDSTMYLMGLVGSIGTYMYVKIKMKESKDILEKEKIEKEYEELVLKKKKREIEIEKRRVQNVDILSHIESKG